MWMVGTRPHGTLDGQPESCEEVVGTSLVTRTWIVGMVPPEVTSVRQPTSWKIEALVVRCLKLGTIVIVKGWSARILL